MGKESDGKACPKLVKLDKAFKLVNPPGVLLCCKERRYNQRTLRGDAPLTAQRRIIQAEMWVNSMGGSTAEASEVEFESRPPRLGLGAKVTRHVEVAASDDLVERKLIGKLGAGKKRAYKGPEHAGATKISEPREDFDDELDSRTSVFDKKKAASSLPKRKEKRTSRQDAG